jgi:hypothetical protein
LGKFDLFETVMKLRLSAPFAASVSLRTTMMAGEGVAVFVIVFGYPRARSRDENV